MTKNENTQTGGNLRVLMLNRPTAFTHRGGDTIVMERAADALRNVGVHVDIDLEGRKDPKQYDLVHLHNFATPAITEAQARLCRQVGVPYVVTTMYEDQPRFVSQMNAYYEALRAYVLGGQKADDWESLADGASHVKPAQRCDNTFTASHAEALIGTGKEELRALRRDYPGARRVFQYQIGCDVRGASDGGKAFYEAYGESDYILCVGRLETRKNQLMLLKALEHSELTLVLAAGGFTYQPEYESLCRGFNRRGRTIIISHMDDDMLASAYEGAKVHVLPSWYELPGLVSLEAGHRGCNVVATRYGTAETYLGEDAYYCSPSDPDSIRNAVLAAYFAPRSHRLKDRMRAFSWAKVGMQFKSFYQACFDTVGGMKLCDDGDLALRENRIDDALSFYQQAINEDDLCARGYRGQAVASMLRGEAGSAAVLFKRAIEADPLDVKSLTGLGTLALNAGQYEESVSYFQRAIKVNDKDKSLILHLVNASFSLDRFGYLESVLRNYVQTEPLDRDIMYCLVGCLCRQHKWQDGKTYCEQLELSEGPTARVIEVKEIIHKGLLNATCNVSPSSPHATMNGHPGQSSQTGGGMRADVSTAPLQGSDGDNNMSVNDFMSMVREAKEKRDYTSAISLAENLLKGSQSLNRIERDELNCLCGESYARQGQFDVAEDAFARVGTGSIYYTRAVVGRGAVFAAKEEWDDARRSFSEALTIDRSNDAALAGLGMCEVRSGRNDVAWRCFTDALTINHENLRALFGVIEVGYSMDRLSEVEVYLRRYLDLHPANVSFLYSLAGCLYAQVKYQDALEEIGKIRLFEPDNQMANELEDKIRHSCRLDGSKFRGHNVVDVIP